jgi:hypothetical protein
MLLKRQPVGKLTQGKDLESFPHRSVQKSYFQPLFPFAEGCCLQRKGRDEPLFPSEISSSYTGDFLYGGP